VATLSVALGIGVNSAMFSFHDAILLRPLPVPEPNAILTVSVSGSEDSTPLGLVSYPNYRDLREKSQSFEGLIANDLMPLSFSRSREAGARDAASNDGQRKLLQRAACTADARPRIHG